MKLPLMLLAAGLAASAQDFSHRGFLETRLVLYPQTAPNDRGRAVAASLVRYEASYKLSPDWRLAGGIDARTDTHHEVERAWGLSWQDRERQRPALAVRRLSAAYSRGPVTLELGKQFIRWGKADILNPTDRFAPRDFLDVVDNDFLAVTAARLNLGVQTNTVELVWAPRFTPSRTPLLDQRWVALPAGVAVRDAGARLPGGPQFGARWNHVGAGLEYSLSFYEGFNHLPVLALYLDLHPRTWYLAVERSYPRLRMYGADAALPLRHVTLKGEAAWFTSRTQGADEYVLYVVQLERQAGEWSLVGGYAGQKVTRARAPFAFAPDRGLASAFLGRAGYTIDVNRSVAFETAVRQNGKGVWLKSEYSQALGQHWRATAAFTVIRGAAGDFLGQYRRNSHLTLALRYSF
ncbi:MAG: hypothetical protein AAB225_16615 [Acidobacteriota bacterium]